MNELDVVSMVFRGIYNCIIQLFEAFYLVVVQHSVLFILRGIYNYNCIIQLFEEYKAFYRLLCSILFSSFSLSNVFSLVDQNISSIEENNNTLN